MSKMPALLLPATASPFAARGKPNVVLKNKVDPWLTANLKRINRIKRPLNSVPQHMKCLTETLAQPSAIWNLCTLMVEKAPTAQLESNDNALVEAFMRYELLHIQAYVVAVDLVLTNEISFKLSQETIKVLIAYHRDIYLENEKAKTWQWTEKDAQCKKLHEQFVQAVNKFVYRTDHVALEGLEDDGAGELLGGRSEDVKLQVMGLFSPLLPPPPPPRMMDIVRPPAQLLPSNAPAPGNSWWSSQSSPSPPQHHQHHYSVSPPPVDAWKILPSSPIEDQIHHSPSPPPAHHHHHQPATTTSSSSFGSIWATSSVQDLAMTASTAAAGGFAMTSSAPIPHLPLPSMVAQQCSLGSNTYSGSFDWQKPMFQDFAATI